MDSRNKRQRQTLLALSLNLLGGSVSAFRSPATTTFSPAWTTRMASLERHRHTLTKLRSTLDKEEVETKASTATKKVGASAVTSASRLNGEAREPNVLDLSSYENSLLSSWDEDVQSGFDWEIEKLRRHFAGLRQRESDGQWVRTPSLFDFLVTHTPSKVVGADVGSDGLNRYEMPPKPVNVMDVGVLILKNLLNGLGFGPSLGMAAVPDAIIQKYEGSFFTFIKGVLGGDLQTLAGGPLFLLLAKYYQVHGPIFNLSFGPKSFLVISDPVMARHILRDSSPEQYCKGMLADILEPIMGDGLIPADPKIWKVRRRAVVPGFHKKWLKNMINLFGDCGDRLVSDLDYRAVAKTPVDMEERFCSVTLDIIGKAVFNYDFGSVTKESPIVKAVYRVLREAEHRSSSFIPYWNLPYAEKWMGGQVEFRKDMGMLDSILAKLINQAVETRQEATVEELEEREVGDDPSLLRFLADMRGEDLTSKVLRDDLMTMLIAGHETTAAMLTWTLFGLASSDPGMMKEIQAEVRTVMGNKSRPDYDDIVKMKKMRAALIEALRLYPEPPVLIRRARQEDTLPPGGSGMSGGIKVLRGTDIFISTWNLHRAPEYWESPEKYDPTRWERPFKNPGIKGWEGYNPEKQNSFMLYPNEVTSDYAFLPFGAGKRKCIGDQFAMLEASVTMSMIINKFDFTLVGTPEDVGMKTGATIHTMNGLNMVISHRSETDPIPETNDWWVQQHLMRGYNVNGRPYATTEDAAWTTSSRQSANGADLRP
eukprot:CAMPEP_0172527972 /NCGR_PEP_ID=MMETSP1067-20121228/2500_1 /TAXON_ID=265564 ORGANISM="Thalassiosira punctigera, Strain Tpunct2005C2" /NCGR_SAMPLE_ID=MMETSP1067 /ASSEMBLY_ACC=CAM_ASM_000444 /LENGTH=764 /DNA_ID=CAMNT_0013311809 /DNA_START=337 /DNA_END=2631 /DNA_ORIENTATION=+